MVLLLARLLRSHFDPSKKAEVQQLQNAIPLLIESIKEHSLQD